MKPPSQFELEHQLAHIYDPVKAHEYYLRTRELMGRKPGRAEDHDVDTPAENRAQQRRARAKAAPGWRDPRTGKSMDQIMKEAKAKARTRIKKQIDKMEFKLKKLEEKIREIEREEASEDRKGKAKKERAAKERDKPKSAAEKAEDAREQEKYRDKHKQELKNKAKKADKKSGGGSDKKDKHSQKATLENYKALATKIKGRIAVAKQKLAAL